MTVGVSVTIDVPSIEEGIAFYGRAFGFVESSRPIPTYVVLKAGDAVLCLMEKAPGTSPAKGSDDTRRYDRHWTPVHVDFKVDDFDAALERAVQAGARNEQVHRVAGYPPVAFCSDPFGHGFCLIGKRS